MSISSVIPFLSGPEATRFTSETRQKSPGASQNEATRAEIREKGLSVWAHDQKMEALKAKLRAEVLVQKKLSEEGLAGLGAEERGSIEAEIEKIIAERLEAALKTAVEEAEAKGKSQAILVDIAV